MSFFFKKEGNAAYFSAIKINISFYLNEYKNSWKLEKELYILYYTILVIECVSGGYFFQNDLLNSY